MPITQEYIREVIDAGLAFQASRQAILAQIEAMIKDYNNTWKNKDPMQIFNALRSTVVESMPQTIHIVNLAMADQQFNPTAMKRNLTDRLKHRRHRHARMGLHAEIEEAMMQISKEEQAVQDKKNAKLLELARAEDNGLLPNKEELMERYPDEAFVDSMLGSTRETIKNAWELHQKDSNPAKNITKLFS